MAFSARPTRRTRSACVPARAGRRRAAASRQAATRTDASPARSPADRSARWRSPRARRDAVRGGCVPGRPRPDSDVSDGRWRSSSSRRSRACSSSGLRRLMPSLRTPRTAPPPSAEDPSPRPRDGPNPATGMLESSALIAPVRDGLRRRETAEARPRRQHDGAISAGLHALRSRGGSTRPPRRS